MFRISKGICFLGVLVFKFFILYLCLQEERSHFADAILSSVTIDTGSYIAPIENLLENGFYSPANRMPGYGGIYFLFRVFCEQTIAVNLLVIFQVLMDVIAVFFLALTLERITKESLAFYLTILLYGIGITASTFNNWIMTESLSTSFLIIGFCFLIKPVNAAQKQKINWFLAGLFVVIAYFHKPILAPIILIGLFFLVIDRIAQGKKISTVIYFLILPIILNGAWLVRNYLVEGIPILLTKRIQYGESKSEYRKAADNMMMCYTDKMSGLSFFQNIKVPGFIPTKNFWSKENNAPPSYLFTELFTEDSLLLLKQEIDQMVNSKTIEEKKYLEKRLSEKIENYTVSIKSNHPFSVYILAPINRILAMIKTSGVYRLYDTPFLNLPLHKKGIKLFFIFIYLLTFLGFIASFFYTFFLILQGTFIDVKLFILSLLIPVYLLIIHAYAGYVETRYTLPGFPFQVMSTVLLYTHFYSKFFARSRNLTP